ncbi:metal-sensitive transcriptional regulator [Patescibacteria group bacterium]|nr:metal-sensitive transcriptional regulator [Patescibacteria group bacterium]
MFHTKTKKDNVLHRLKIIRGHLDKIVQMVEDDAYCIDVLTQTKAVQSSLNKVDEVLLENHLSHCVVEHIQEGQTQLAVDEVMKVFRKKS